MTLSILEALDHPDLFAGMFDAPSWAPWKSFLAALFALPMDPTSLELYRRHTGRQAPPPANKPFRSATLVIGRRGGKSRTLALIAVFLAACVNHTRFLVAGEVPVIAIIAADRRQARIILDYVSGLMRAVPCLAVMIEDQLAESLRLTNGVQIEVHTASLGSPRGRTFLAVLCDETAFWPTGDSANPDVEVINAVRPGLSTIPYSLLLVASSPYAKRGVLYSNYSRYFGKDDAPVLVWQGTTREMNASLIDDPLIAEMELEDPERASAEFGAQFRSDIVNFITREAIEACVSYRVYELPAGGGITYAGFVDPSGGSADSMTLAIAHLESDGTAILDCIREVRPPFSPDQVTEQFATTLKAYSITRVNGDAYAGEWPRERFAVHGISYDVSKRNKSQIYSEFLPALNGRRVRLLDLPRLTGQLTALERRTARGGRDSVDHAPGSHDDVANAACGALTTVIADRRPALVSPNSMLQDERPLPLPAVVMTLFGVLVQGDFGQFAALYAALDTTNTLLILDFDAGPLRGDVFGATGLRLWGISEQVRAARGVAGIWTHPELAQQAEILGIKLHAVPDVMLDIEKNILPAASHASAGRVKMCEPAYERAKAHPLGGSLTLKAGDAFGSNDDPLRTAAVWAIGLGLDGS